MKDNNQYKLETTAVLIQK